MTAAHCPRCDREWRPWPLGRHYDCGPKWWATCIRNERAPDQERRAACLLCGLRCDPDRWVCSNCHPRLMRLAVESTLEEAKRVILCRDIHDCYEGHFCEACIAKDRARAALRAAGVES